MLDGLQWFANWGLGNLTVGIAENSEGDSDLLSHNSSTFVSGPFGLPHKIHLKNRSALLIYIFENQ